MLRCLTASSVCLSLFLVVFTTNAGAVTLPPSKLLITSVQTGGITGERAAYDEFVELYNPSPEALSVEGWTIVYTTYKDTSPKTLATLQGSVPGNSFILVASPDHKTIHGDLADYDFVSTSGLADSGGHITVKTPTESIDRVGWGSATAPEGVSPTTLAADAVAPTATRGESIVRCSSADNKFVDSENNAADFRRAVSAHGQIGPRCTVPLPDTGGSGGGNTLTCEGIIINEILPNSAGSDTGREFIELYNPSNEVVSLNGCNLQTSSSGKMFPFQNIALPPNTYATFYDDETGLVLPNSSGGTVWLLSPSSELQAVTYPGDIDDDATWAYILGVWQLTYRSTPNALNVLLGVKPCPIGQERNLTTTRCASSVTPTVADLSCKPGQERNPATNRCRSIFTTTTNLLACKSGQERNPATNRCRSVASASTLAPCAPGQERNLATNRCRKTGAAGNSANLANVKDVTTGPISKNVRWSFVGLAVLGALGYAVYEWRRDVFNFIRKWRPRSTSE